MIRFHKIKNRVYATNQLEIKAKMSLYYNMKMYCGDITVHGKYKFYRSYRRNCTIGDVE